MTEQQIQIPAGVVVITTFGPIRHETAFCLLEMRSFSEKQGLVNVAWSSLPGALVEKARNEAVRQFLGNKDLGWLLLVDGDMTFQPDSLLRLLQVAYSEMPFVDVIGAYCPLRGELSLPTIDTGTGTWESHFPGSGVLEVMRTGAAFILTKRHVFERLQDPWFRMRVPARPLDFMYEVDNFARIKFDGRNPFRDQPGQEWERLERCAQEDVSAGGQFTPVEVGEDSGFCDRVKAAGMRIFVHTDVATGHVDTTIRGWLDHKTAIEKMHLTHRQIVGVLE